MLICNIKCFFGGDIIINVYFCDALNIISINQHQLRFGGLSILLCSMPSLHVTPASEVLLYHTTKSKENSNKVLFLKDKVLDRKDVWLKWVFQSLIFADSWWPAWQLGLWLFSTLTSTSGTTSSSKDTRLARKCPRTSLQPRSSVDCKNKIYIWPQDCAAESKPFVLKRSLCAIVIYVQRFRSNNNQQHVCFQFSNEIVNSVKGFIGGRDKGFILWHSTVFTWHKS